MEKWTSVDGNGGASPDDTPLDELSFIYFIRTLKLTPGANFEFDRHFDPARNPVVIRVIRAETIPTGMGELKTMLVEMHVEHRGLSGPGRLGSEVVTPEDSSLICSPDDFVLPEPHAFTL